MSVRRYLSSIYPGHGSRPPSASLPTPAALKKEPDEPPHRVKMEPHTQSGGEDSAADLGVDGIKTEIDGLMDSDGKILIVDFYHLLTLEKCLAH